MIKDKIIRVYWKLMTINPVVGAITTVLLITLIPSGVICLWIGLYNKEWGINIFCAIATIVAIAIGQWLDAQWRK